MDLVGIEIKTTHDFVSGDERGDTWVVRGAFRQIIDHPSGASPGLWLGQLDLGEEPVPAFRIEGRTDYSDGDPDKEAGFYILQHTRCAAALTENGFQDFRESLQFLESPEGKKAIVTLHVVGILAFIDAKPR